jgi:hypothetical protein
MELGKKKNRAIIAVVLILTMTALMVVIPAGAQIEEEMQVGIEEGTEIPTFLQLSVAPNPVGKGQTLFINTFMTKPTLTAEDGGGGDRYEPIIITMVKPAGNTYEFPPLTADPTGGAWTQWSPDQVGEYTFQAVYPGQHIERTTYPLFGSPTFYNFTYLASTSEIVTVTVQEDPVEWIYSSPGLPEEYWTRPIYATNWAWGQLGGSWFGLAAPAFATTGGYDATGNFNPYTKAPNTAHIMWSKSTHFGGQPGLPIPSDQEHQYMSTSVATNFFEPVILNGILFYTKMGGPNPEKVSWEAVDIRTGETLWSRSAGKSGNEVIKMGQIVRYHSMEEYGSWAFLYGIESAGFFGVANFLSLYDAYTGEYIANITDTQSAQYIVETETNTPGSLLGYYSSGGNLTMWNSTKLMLSGIMGYMLIRPSGTYNWSAGIEWSVPLPTELNGIPISLSLSVVSRDTLVVIQRPTPGMWVSLSYGYQIAAGYNATTGELLWGPVNQSIPYLQDVSVVAAGDGVYVLHNKDKNEAYGFSLTDGKQLWGPVKLVGNGWSTISRSGDVAYGLCYIWDIGGYVNALDLQTGDIVWNFTRGSAGYDTPFGVYPLWYNDAIADGKIYLSEGTMYTPPLHPARTICLNATTGEMIWNILSYSGRVSPAIADGHMLIWNSFDMKMYSFGKGPTQTTVTAPDTAVQLGSSVLIKGTVMDISAGAEQDGVIERFPNGLPAVADESMTEWMEYVYMQQEEPEDVEGAKVFLKIQDPNGEWYSTTVTTDRNGRFSHMWAPAVVGEYHVTTMFEGSESYYPSQETTTFGVDEAPTTEDVPSAEEIADTTAGKLPAYPAASDIAQETINKLPAYLTMDLIILVIAAVGVVIGLIAYMALRKQK